MKSTGSTTAFNWVVLLGLVMVWGSSFILMKRGLEHFPHYQLALIRISIACIFLIPFAIRLIKKLKRKKIGYIALSGLIGNGIPAFLFAKAQTHIDSSLAGVLNSLTPLFVLIVGILFFKIKTKWYNIIGVFIGLAGTIGLMSISGNKSLDFNFTYGIYVIIATLMYAININLIKYFLQDTDAITITAFAFLFIGIPFMCYLFLATDFVTILTYKPGAWSGLGYIAILGVFGSGVAIMLYNKLIQSSGVLFAASVTYMMPVVSELWGIADGEDFSAIYLLWIAIILFGVFLVNYNFQKSPSAKI